MEYHGTCKEQWKVDFAVGRISPSLHLPVSAQQASILKKTVSNLVSVMLSQEVDGSSCWAQKKGRDLKPICGFWIHVLKRACTIQFPCRTIDIWGVALTRGGAPSRIRELQMLSRRCPARCILRVGLRCSPRSCIRRLSVGVVRGCHGSPGPRASHTLDRAAPAGFLCSPSTN